MSQRIGIKMRTNNLLVKNKKDFIVILKNHLAETSVGPSVLRKQGPEGMIKVARDYLKRLDLEKFAKCSKEDFQKELNRATKKLRNAFPGNHKNWGAARKVINIFLRNAVYNRNIYRYYRLRKIKHFLEVPLDSYVGKWLMEYNEGLPAWYKLKELKSEDSNKFQDFAKNLARKNKISRVDLDIIFWRKE